jgi:hypothetical protein
MFAGLGLRAWNSQAELIATASSWLLFAERRFPKNPEPVYWIMETERRISDQ